MGPQRPNANKGSRANGGALVPRPRPSAHTPASGAPAVGAPAAGADLAEDLSKLSINTLTEDVPVIPLKRPRRPKLKPFRFLELPYELRLEVYSYHFGAVGEVLDLDPDNHKRIHQKLAILRTCRTISREASYLFFSTHTARIFPTHPGRFFKTKKPLLARLKPHQRANLTTLELRLGPGWSKPPPGWVVKPELGLKDCVNVRRIVVFAECDPSNDVFKGFRQANGFFEAFSQHLLEGILDDMPWVKRLEFDAWPSVKKKGSLMLTLLDIAANRQMKISWGKERGWTDADEEEEPPVSLNLNAPLRAMTSHADITIVA